MKPPEETVLTSLEEYPKNPHLPEALTKYGMNIKDGAVSSREAVSMIDQFPIEATYYALKLLKKANEHTLFNETLETFLNAQNRAEYQEYLRTVFTKIPSTVEIGGSKPVSISRYGFEHYQNMWAHFYEKHAPLIAQGKTMILGLSPIFGLRHAVATARKAGAKELVFLTGGKNATELTGVRIVTNGERIRLLPFEPNTEITGDVLIVDDIENTGDTKLRTEKIFKDKYPLAKIHFEALVHTNERS